MIAARRAWPLAALVVGTLLAGFFARDLPWSATWQAMAGADARWLALALAIHLGVYPAWALQWQLIAPGDRPVSFGAMLGTVALVSSANSLVPFGGPAAALVLLVRECGLRAGSALGLIAVDQALAALTKVLLVGAALAPAAHAMEGWHRAGAASLAIAALALAAGCLALAWSGEGIGLLAARVPRFTSRALHALSRFASGLDALRQPSRILPAILLAIGKRAAEVCAAACVAASLGMSDPALAALVAIAAVGVATAVPLTPGHVGTYEAAAILGYQAMGADPAQAFAAALLQHGIALSAALVPGYVLLIARQFRLR